MSFITWDSKNQIIVLAFALVVGVISIIFYYSSNLNPKTRVISYSVQGKFIKIFMDNPVDKTTFPDVYVHFVSDYDLQDKIGRIERTEVYALIKDGTSFIKTPIRMAEIKKGDKISVTSNQNINKIESGFSIKEIDVYK